MNDYFVMGRKSVPEVQLLQKQLEGACPEALKGADIQPELKPEASTEIISEGEPAAPLNDVEARACVSPALLEHRRATVTKTSSTVPLTVAHTASSASPSVRMKHSQRGSRKLLPDEEEKVDQFIRQYLKWLTGLAAQLVGRIDAEDVVQNACVNLVLYIREMPQQESIVILDSDKVLRSLIGTITLRRAYDVLRMRKRNREDLTTDHAGVERGDDRSMLHSQAAIDVAKLERVYSAMPPIQRIVHILHHFYGYTARECVVILKELPVETRDLTESGVETQIFRATKELKRAMETKP